MPKYIYQVVAGAGVFGQPHLTLAEARTGVLAVRTARFPYPNAEVERMLVLNNNAHRYWRWRGGRWSFGRHYNPTEADLAKWSAA
jgi:hypothetical protein